MLGQVSKPDYIQTQSSRITIRISNLKEISKPLNWSQNLVHSKEFDKIGFGNPTSTLPNFDSF